MSAISDEELYAYSDRVKGKVVVITGAANGIGKKTAQAFAKYGAKVVIGDRDVNGAEATVAELKLAGGEAVFHRCDVLNWDEQVSLFELAISTHCAVDIVIPNAGVTEMGAFTRVAFKDGKPVKPRTTTIEVNLIGAMYTAHLALHYLKIGKADGSLKALIFIGSMASWQAIPGASMYSASKHGILGLMRSLEPILALDGIRTNIVHPWFADTAIIPTTTKVLLAGLPTTSVDRIAGALFYAASCQDMEISGCPLLLLDQGPVFRLEKEELKEGVYGLLDARMSFLLKNVSSVRLTINFVADIWRLFGGKARWMLVFLLIAYGTVKLIG